MIRTHCRTSGWGALVFPLALMVSAAGAQQVSGAAASISVAGWLAGSWRMERNGRVVDEQWMAPAGGVMLGMSRTLAKGKVAEFEFVQIREGPEGGLFYIAQPSRQKEATFKLVAHSDGEIVFENREYDFPQVIGYRLNADGSLLAWIEGPRSDGTTRRIEYAYQRAAR